MINFRQLEQKSFLVSFSFLQEGHIGGKINESKGAKIIQNYFLKPNPLLGDKYHQKLKESIVLLT